MGSKSHQWKLEKYARYLGPVPGPSARGKTTKTKSNDNQKWKLYEGDKEALTLTVTESHHLLITYGKDIQENHSLWNGHSWMKGINKDDSLLIIYQIQDETRQFRVKLSGDGARSSVEQCTDCMATLSRYFMFKRLTPEKSDTQESGNQAVSGEVPLSKLAQIVTGQLKEQLPKSYQTTQLPTEPAALQVLTQLCLTDTNFPAFVGAVEAALGHVMTETGTDVKN